MLDDLLKAQWLPGDRGYDAAWFRDALAANGIKPCIPGRKSRNAPVKHDERRYRRRNRIEIMFGRFKGWRRIATRYDRCPTVFFSVIALSATVLFWLQAMSPDPRMRAQESCDGFDVGLVHHDRRARWASRYFHIFRHVISFLRLRNGHSRAGPDRFARNFDLLLPFVLDRAQPALRPLPEGVPSVADDLDPSGITQQLQKAHRRIPIQMRQNSASSST